MGGAGADGQAMVTLPQTVDGQWSHEAAPRHLVQSRTSPPEQPEWPAVGCAQCLTVNSTWKAHVMEHPPGDEGTTHYVPRSHWRAHTILGDGTLQPLAKAHYSASP